MIVHALLTPGLDIKGLIGVQPGTRRTTESTQESVDECHKVLELMDLTGKVGVYPGARQAMKAKQTPEIPPATQLIVKK